LEGKIDVIQVTHVLHQWGWEGQIEAAKQVAKLSKPGSLIVGFQADKAGGATKEPGESLFHSWMRHDPESWAEMWDVVGKDTGMESKSDAALLQYHEIGDVAKDVEYLGPLSRILGLRLEGYARRKSERRCDCSIFDHVGTEVE
jgi:hypothetical protein